MGIDTLYVKVAVPGSPPVEVWSSDATFGTTHGQCIPVGIDLSSFGGQEVSLQLAFSTGDVFPPLNDHFGALIDNLVVEMTCDPCCP